MGRLAIREQTVPMVAAVRISAQRQAQLDNPTTRQPQPEGLAAMEAMAEKAVELTPTGATAATAVQVVRRRQ
jgi:hypothetical protein